MMTKVRSLLLGAVLVVGAFGSIATHAAPRQGCTNNQDKGTKTAAGSHKDGSAPTNCNGAIHCGDGPIPPIEHSDGTKLRVFVTPDAATGPEVEACNDSGTGTTQGRLVARVNTDDPGVRVSLDTDDQTPQFPGGYINVQAGQKGTGLWCNKPTDGAQGKNMDAYEQPWDKPGTDGGADQNALNCVPGND